MAKQKIFQREKLMNLYRRLLVALVALMTLSCSEALAQIAFVKTIGTTASSSNGTSTSITVPASGVAGGNSVIITFAMNPTAGSVSCFDSRGNTYVLNREVTNGSGNSGVRTVILSSHNISALSSGNVIFCSHPNVSPRVLSVNEFSGLASSSTTDQVTSATGASTAPSSGSTASTTQASELLIGGIGVEGPTTETFTAGANYTAPASSRAGTSGGNAANNITINPEYRIVSATGTYAATGTLSSSRLWAAAIATYKARILPTKLTITSVNGGANPIAGTAFSVTVQAQDASGTPANVLSATSISLSRLTGTGILGGTLNGTIPANTSQVTISGVTYTTAESGVVLTATRTGGDSLTPGNSAPFTVNSGPAAVLSFATQPGNTTAGATIPGPPSVLVRDAFGNNVTSTMSVTMALGDFNGGATLSGTTTKATTGGTASFTDLNINKASIGYTLRASATGVSSTTSNLFNVSPGSATKLVFVTQPGNSTTSGAIIGPPTVSVQDNQGNTISSSSASLSVVIATNPGGGTLTGTTVRNASGGAGAFADLKINQPGTGYTLTATSSSLTSATTTAFNILSGGSVAGTVSKAAGGGAVTGASIEALQSGVVKGTASTSSAGSYTISGLVPGSYDIRADAGGFSPQTQTGVTVNAGATATANFSLATSIPTAGIVYLYDELQRLKSVIDPVGEAASYAYDAVGNLLSITRNTASQTSIIDFNPNSGPIGGTVTLYGTGFSTTANQNSVTFNGVAATVVSSTLTQIVTTVPAGATTGLIAVTSPAGSATSATAFSVTGAPVGAPTIANFTPNIGVVGTAVTINGTNFDPTPANNEARFNPTLAAVTTATAATLQSSFPTGGRAGPISVSTPGGSATSSQDFFLVPPPYTAANVGFTTRRSIGGGSLTINLAAKIALVLFNGSIGQKINLALSNITVDTSLYVYNPSGTLLASRGYLAGGTLTPIDRQLMQTGTYTILLNQGANVGSATVTLSEELDAGTIVINGAAVTVTTANGQDAHLTFSGASGQKINLALSNMTIDTGLFVYNPDGTLLASQGYLAGGAPTPIDRQLTQTGTYTILINHGANAGSATLTLSEELDAGTIAINGSPVTVTISRVGQNAHLTFSGTQGQNITLTGSNVTVSTNVFIYPPGSTTPLTSGTFGGAGGSLGAQLPADGTYTILLDPSLGTGSLTLTLTSP